MVFFVNNGKMKTNAQLIIIALLGVNVQLVCIAWCVRESI